MSENTPRGVTYRAPDETYFEERGLRRFAGAWSLWALGVGAVISGDFFGWNFGLLAGGFGGLLLATECLRHRQIFRELSGAITMLKLLLLGAAYHGFLPLPGTVLLVFVIASIGAHAPKKVRHRLLF